jgi:hypothetical protein
MSGRSKTQIPFALASGQEDDAIILQEYQGALKIELIMFIKILVSMCDASKINFAGALYAQNGALPLNNMARIKDFIVNKSGSLKTAIDEILINMYSQITLDDELKQKLDTFTKCIMAMGDRISSSRNINGGMNFDHKAVMPFTLHLKSQSAPTTWGSLTNDEQNIFNTILGFNT